MELKSVHFSYDGEKEVLKDISLTIPEGRTVAFVGPSGGGKTTLANLISRFFDPQSGMVTCLLYTSRSKMAKKKTQIPKYGTITLKGIQYYRTRITDADGKEVSLYATTCEELYAVSYTHLDVYKRQVHAIDPSRC